MPRHHYTVEESARIFREWTGGTPAPILPLLDEIDRLRARISELEALDNEPTQEWGYRWTKPNGETYVRACQDEADARETVDNWPNRAAAVRREIVVGEWVEPE